MTNTPLAAWVERARQAHGERRAFLGAAHAYAETASHGTREHSSYLSHLFQAEMDKADAAHRYAQHCDKQAGELLADRDHAAMAGEAS